MSDRALPGQPPLHIVVDGHVATIVLDRPDALNAISTGLAEALTREAATIESNDEVRVVIVRSSSTRAFCVGADLRERSTMTVTDLMEQRPVMTAAYDALASLAVPTIAAVEGFALGGGFELALACDLIVADDTAVFGFPEVAVGLIPGGGGAWQLATRVGAARTTDLVVTGRRLSFTEADEWGLVSRSAPHGQVSGIVNELARTIAQNAPIAVRHAKASLRDGLYLDRTLAAATEDWYWRRTAATNDRAEGITAFAEKRKPVWSGS